MLLLKLGKQRIASGAAAAVVVVKHSEIKQSQLREFVRVRE
jgi:hypothetical protein